MMCTNKSISEQTLQKQLQLILEKCPNTIKACVAQEALDYSNIKGFFKDLLQNGCISGMVSSLVYYCDTENFFDKHYEEIITLKIAFEESTGTALKIPHQVKNYLAWFAFKQIAYKLVRELKLNVDF